jgi:hypothetical protein
MSARPIARTCRQCGTPFTAPAKSRATLCSSECRRLFCTAAGREASIAWHRATGHRLPRACRWCGESFELGAFEVSRGRGQFCSESHAARWGNARRRRRHIVTGLPLP